MYCKVRVISGALICSDDGACMFTYRPKCPICGMLTDGEMRGVAVPNDPYEDNCNVCPKCNKWFTVKVVRDQQIILRETRDHPLLKGWFFYIRKYGIL